MSTQPLPSLYPRCTWDNLYRQKLTCDLLLFNQMIQPSSFVITAGLSTLYFSIFHNILFWIASTQLLCQNNLFRSKALMNFLVDSISDSDHRTRKGGDYRDEIKINILQTFIIELDISLSDLEKHFVMIFFCLSQFLLVLHFEINTLSYLSCSSWEILVSVCFSTLFFSKANFFV